MNPERLPNDGQVSIDAVWRSVRAAEEYLGTAASLDVRTVLRDEEGRRDHFVTVARAVPHEPEGTDTIELNGARLIRYCTGCEVLENREAVLEALTRWRGEVGASSDARFRDPAPILRQPRQSPWSELPAYVIELDEDVDGDRRSPRSPSHRPYFHPERELFAESFSTLAAEFLDLPVVAGWSAFHNGCRVILPDATGWIESISKGERSVEVRISANDPSYPLYCAAVAKDFDGTSMRATRKVEDLVATLAFPRSPKVVDLWLLAHDGQWLDALKESIAAHQWWNAYRFPDGEHPPIEQEVMKEIDGGESEVLEFKPWIRLTPQDSKRREILEVASSFANSGGGSILFGVDRTGSIVPFSKDRKRVGLAKGPYDEARDEYAKILGRFVTEGLNPAPAFDVTWHSVATHHVLRLRVERGSETPYSLADTGDIYVRRGATSRKMRQDEAHELLRAPGLR